MAPPLLRAAVAALSLGANKIDVFRLGTTQSDIQHSSYGGQSWSKWESLGGNVIDVPAVASYAPGKIDIVSRSYNHTAYWKSYNGKSWSTSYTDLAGVYISPLHLTSRLDSNSLDLLALGTDSTVLHSSNFNGSWSPPTPLGLPNALGSFVSPVSSISQNPQRLAYWSLGTDSQAWHSFTFDGITWLEWAPRGGQFNSGFVIAETDNSTQDAFAIGKDNSFYAEHYNGTDWADWHSLGGTFVSEAAVVSSGAKTSSSALHAFAIDTSSAMYYKQFTPSRGWDRSWTNLGGVFVSAPTAVSWGPGRVDVFGVGTDNKVYHKYWNNGGWSYAWENMG